MQFCIKVVVLKSYLTNTYVRNQSENDDILQEHENLWFAPSIIF